MITANTVVTGRPIPDLTLEQFTAILEAVSSPALIDAEKSYQAIVNLGVSPAFCLAIFLQESGMGTVGLAVPNKNPGNTRSSTTGIGIMVTTTKGVFIKYPYWWEGWRDLAWRLVKPDYVYAQEGRKTIAQIIERWAPNSDGNDSARYIANVISAMNKWVGSSEVTMKDPTTNVRLIPGHAGRGRSGAKPELCTIHVQEGTNDLPAYFAQSGDDSTMWCMQDGTLVRMLNDTDTPYTNGDVIAPDMSNPVIARLVNSGVTNTNRFAYTIENQGFASIGFTVAQIESNAQMCAYWFSLNGWDDVDNRIVGHFQVGPHKGCPGPKYPWAKLRARVKELLGGTHLNTDNQGQPAATTFPGGKMMAGGFGAFYDKLKTAGLELLTYGYPVTNEFDCLLGGKIRTVQLGERAAFIYEQETPAPWDVHFATTGDLLTIVTMAKSKGLI